MGMPGLNLGQLHARKAPLCYVSNHSDPFLKGQYTVTWGHQFPHHPTSPKPRGSGQYHLQGPLARAASWISEPCALDRLSSHFARLFSSCSSRTVGVLPLGFCRAAEGGNVGESRDGVPSEVSGCPAVTWCQLAALGDTPRGGLPFSPPHFPTVGVMHRPPLRCSRESSFLAKGAPVFLATVLPGGMGLLVGVHTHLSPGSAHPSRTSYLDMDGREGGVHVDWEGYPGYTVLQASGDPHTFPCLPHSSPCSCFSFPFHQPQPLSPLPSPLSFSPQSCSQFSLLHTLLPFPSPLLLPFPLPLPHSLPLPSLCHNPSPHPCPPHLSPSPSPLSLPFSPPLLPLSLLP